MDFQENKDANECCVVTGSLQANNNHAALSLILNLIFNLKRRNARVLGHSGGVFNGLIISRFRFLCLPKETGDASCKRKTGKWRGYATTGFRAYVVIMLLA